MNISEAHVIRYMLNLEKRKCTVNFIRFFSHIVGLAFVLVGFVVAGIRE